MSHTVHGHPGWMGYSGEFWQDVVHWGKEWQTTPVFWPREPHKQYEWTKRYDTRTWASQVGRCPVCSWGRAEKSSRKNEGMAPKQKQFPVVDVNGDRSKVRCCKEQYCIGTWNVMSVNQGSLEVVKQMTRVNIDILGISELKWTGMGGFNSDDHYI